MKQAAATALTLAALLAASGAQQPLAHDVRPVAARIPAPAATSTLPVPQVPTYVRDVSTPATTGWSAVQVSRVPAPLDDQLLAAYSFAVAVAPERCHLPLSLLAAIGQVESGNAAGHTLDAGHRVVPAIVGPALDGSKYAAVPDTDAGALDGDTKWDRAVGPFQFIPSSWRVAGVDFDNDGVRDPQDVYDAAGAAMVYLCAADRDLDDPAQLADAVLAYNHSRAYLRTVQAWKAVFDQNGVWDPGSASGLEATSLARTPVPAPVHTTAAVHHPSKKPPAPVPVAKPAVPASADVPASQPDPGQEPAPTPDPTAPADACPTVDPSTGDVPVEEPTEAVPSDEASDEPSDEASDEPTDGTVADAVEPTDGTTVPPDATTTPDPCAPATDPGDPTDPTDPADPVPTSVPLDPAVTPVP